MPVLYRYAIREIASFAAAGFVIVVAVFVVTRLGSLLADAAVGSLPAAVVAELLLLRTIMALPSLLPAVLYLGVLLGLSRLSRDLEITALEACGVPPARLHGAILTFAAFAAAVIAFLSFTGRPWAASRFNAVREHAIAQSGLENVSPGRFYETDPESHEVLFAESRSHGAQHSLENVFVQRRDDRGITIYYADRAVETRDEKAGYRFLTLIHGVQYDLRPNGGDEQVTEYQELTIRTPIGEAEPDLGEQKTRSVADLLRSGDLDDEAELQWRTAMPVSAFLLALLAIPLGRVRPRAGGYANIFTAVVLYIAYRSLLGTVRNWVSDGTLPPVPGLWLVHGGALLAALVLIAWRVPSRGRLAALLGSGGASA